MTTVEGKNVPNVDVAPVRLDEGEIIQLGPVRLRVLEDGSRTDQRIGAVELTVPPHTPGPQQHWHQMHDETFLIVSGKVTFTSRTANITLGAGEVMIVPPMSPHTFANNGDEPAVIYNTFTPGYYVNYFRLMARMAADASGQITPEIARSAMLRYATVQTRDEGYEW